MNSALQRARAGMREHLPAEQQDWTGGEEDAETRELVRRYTDASVSTDVTALASMLRGGARIAVIAAEWHDAFCLVTRGRVQLELRDGEPGPALERDAGFWLRGTGVRALRNPGRRRARVRIITPPGSQGPHIPVKAPRTPMTGGTT
ncbi:MAG: hypothetical protein M0026_09550 [Nocardiopsaceae bacterium]|nr:hypothetical protein [Nocardiopsaceae bacterium]